MQRHYFADKSPSSQSYVFSSSHVWMWDLDHRRLKKWCFWIVVLEKTLETPLDNKEIKPEINPECFHWKHRCWSWSSNALATCFEELTLWRRSWCWESLRVEEEGDRGWDGWMTTLTWWTWVWASSGRWWRTGRPGVLQSIRSQSQTRLSQGTATAKPTQSWAHWIIPS